eukprot:1958243-Alexandrium_andersonii.AAC.2
MLMSCMHVPHGSSLDSSLCVHRVSGWRGSGRAQWLFWLWLFPYWNARNPGAECPRSAFHDVVSSWHGVMGAWAQGRVL